jgi:outer membrane protein
MKPFAPFVLILAIILSLAAFAQTGNAAAPAGSSPAPAGSAPPPTVGAPTKIGVIDIQAAILGSNEGQRDLETLQKRFEPKQTELQGLNKEIEELRKQLQTQGEKLNDDARATLLRSIETKQKGLQRSTEDADAEARGAQNEMFNRIGQKLMQSLDKYAKDHGFALIMNYNPRDPQEKILWGVPAVDVTRAIVEAYNAQSGVPAPARPAGGAKPGAAGIGARPAPTKPAGTPPQKPATTTPPKQ